VDGFVVGIKPEGRDKMAVVDSAEGSVADEEVMVEQGSFGTEEDFDVTMVESGGLQGEAGGNMVQVQTMAAETVEISDFATHQHAAEAGMHTLPSALVDLMHCVLIDSTAFTFRLT
jgi:hypothetical protein